MVAQLLYTETVGGSNPSSPTSSEKLKAETLKSCWPVGLFESISISMKSRIVSALLVLATAGFLFAQAEQVKGKAKDLKKKVEGQQTNQVDKANPPKK